MANTYIHQKKTTWIATPPHVLDQREEVEADTGKQITNVHSNAHKVIAGFFLSSDP
jgi:hypothetical protein